MNGGTIRPLSERVKQQFRGKRGYHSPCRAEQAAATRRAVLDAARELFIAHGYASATA